MSKLDSTLDITSVSLNESTPTLGGSKRGNETGAGESEMRYKTLSPLGPVGPVIKDPSAAMAIPGSPFSPCK